MKVKTLKPLGARVLIERGEAEEKTASGILIPGQSQERPQDGVVIAIGPDVEGISVGTKVLLPKYGGTLIEDEGLEYTLIPVEDILGLFAAEEVSDDDLDEDLGERQCEDAEVCESCQ